MTTKPAFKKLENTLRNFLALTMVLAAAIIDLAILGPMFLGTFKEVFKIFHH